MENKKLISIFGVIVLISLIMIFQFVTIESAGETKTINIDGKDINFIKEGDKLKGYDNATQTIYIKDDLTKEDILNITLETPRINFVTTGNQKIAQLNLNSNLNIDEVINSFEFYDLNKNSELINRTIDVKVLSYSIDTNSTMKEVWSDFNNSVKIGDVFTIGLFVDVQAGDHIEWIPTIADVKVSEWAEWQYSSVLFDIDPPEAGSSGVAYNGTHYIVVGFASTNFTVFWPNWTYTNINRSIVSETDPTGIYWNGTELLVTGNTNHAVQRFWPNLTFIGNWSYAGTFTSAGGISGNGTHFFLAKVNLPNIFVFTLGGTYTGITYNVTSSIVALGGDNIHDIIRAGSSWYLPMLNVNNNSFAKFNDTFGYQGAINHSNLTKDWRGGTYVSANNTFILVSPDTDFAYSFEGILLNIAPYVNLINPINIQNFTTSSVTFAVTPNDAEDLTGLGVRIYTNISGSWSINQSNSSAYNGTQTNFTITGIPDGVYLWNVEVNDTGGSSAFNTTNRTFLIDTLNPNITFGTGTQNNNTAKAQNFTFINATYTEINPSFITFRIGNSTGNWNTTIYRTTSNTTNTTINFTVLADGTYYYNFTLNDSVGNSNTSDTRYISLDFTNPPINITSPIDATGNLTAFVNVTSDDAESGTFYCEYNITHGQSIDITTRNLTNQGDYWSAAPILEIYTSFIASTNCYNNAGLNNITSISFIFTAPPVSGGEVGGGGGGGNDIIASADKSSEWSLETNTGSKKYTIIKSSDSIRDLDLVFENTGDKTRQLTLTCVNVKGDLCSLITFEEQQFELPLTSNIKISRTITVMFPIDAGENDEIANIFATDDIGKKDFLTVEAVSSGFLAKLFSKMGTKSDYFNLYYWIVYVLITTVLWTILSFTLIKQNVGYGLLASLVVSLVILLFI